MPTPTAATGGYDTPQQTVLAIDTHAHVFTRDLPLAGERRYAPNYDALLSAYLAQLGTHGIAHGVLVQPSFLGTDNRYLLAALAQERHRLRGIAVIAPVQAAADSAHLDALARGGVVGIRLNLFGAPDPNWATQAWQTLLPRIAALGWQVEVHCEACRLRRVVPTLVAHGINVVVDHFGRPDPALGVADTGFRDLLGFATSRRVWVKLSGAYRNGAGEAGVAVARAATPLLRTAFGLERLVWGSDWPHTQFEHDRRFENAYALIHELLPDDDDRRVVLVETPARLFKFD